MNLKKIFSAVIGAVMTLGMAASVSSFAVDEGIQNPDEKLTDGTFTYELIDGSYTIVSCETSAIISSVPELRNGYAITAIGDGAFTGCTMISTLELPSSIKTIGNRAFAGCTSLKTVNLPARLTTVSNSLFMGCQNLEHVYMPDSVETIASYAFYNCSKLAEIELPKSLTTIEPMAFAACSSIENIDADNTPNFVFEDGILYNSSKSNIYRASTKLSGDVYIENTVNTIESGAFTVCVGIENLFLPPSVTTIGDSAFGYCMGLKNIDFSEGLREISDIAFKSCASLETADFPTTLETIGEGAFFDCTSLNRVILPENISSIGEGAFALCGNLKQVGIPKSITEIGDHAFGFSVGENGEYSEYDDFRLSVYSDSAGEKYAKSNKIDYTTVDKSLKGMAFMVIIVGILLAAAVFAIVLMARSKKGAPRSAKKAEKEAKEKEKEENYESIISKEDEK